ncbi:MAG: ATPase [Gammaproteobacteria bacterium]|nr:ATPase [Gammaproteobacteria bacterium]
MDIALAKQTLQGQLTTLLAGFSRPLATETSQRLQRLVGLFRGLVGIALLGGGLIFGDPPILGERYPDIFITTALIYTLLAWTDLAYMYRNPMNGLTFVPVQLFADITGITLMMHASGGISSGIGGLLVVFIGAASLTLRSRHAYFGAAIAALAILGEQAASFALGLSTANSFIPAGVLGAIIFAIASAANPLARRLQESEALAHQRGIDLANMAQLNDYIIQHLRESIVVVDSAENIRLINPSAAKHLGVNSRQTGHGLASVSPVLHGILLGWRAATKGHGKVPGSFTSADGTAQIDVHIAPLIEPQDGPVMIFLEDASLIAEKVQQTKLAALGRLSASIAHEIRNPVGALSHAGQLLEESQQTGDYERRLLDIIGTNSKRVSKIVDNVMQLSRREPTNPRSISLTEWIGEFTTEFISTLELPDNRFEVIAEHEIEVRMDPGHLHQICWNLCENALNYAEPVGHEQIITINCGRLSGNRRPFLEIADRGPGIPDDLREQLFEPFATGRIGGTGLGLFISRELCECNRATLIYERRSGGGSVFRIVFADPKRWGTIL